MPRTSGIYTKPFPDVTSGQTIASAVHNGIMGDVETDLNDARPIIAGGTGAKTAVLARTNLQVERSMQAVTNFDSHVWEMGSFVAVVGATAGPPSGGTTTEHFFGIAYGDTVNMFVEARSLTTGLNYVRRKVGTWSAWALDGGDKLSNTGGTITGNLQITGTLGVTGTTTLGTLNAGAASFSSLTVNPGATNVKALTTTTINTVGNTITAGTVNAGAITGSSLNISGSSTLTGSIAANAISCSTINTNGYTITAGPINAGAISAGIITCAEIITGDGKFTRTYAPTTGAIYFGAGGSIYLHYDGSKFIFSGGNVQGTFVGDLTGNITGSANYATSSNYANSAGSAPANGGVSTTARNVVTNDPNRTWSFYGTGTNIVLDDSSGGVRAAEFTAYGTNGPGTVDLKLPYHTVTTNGVNGSFTNSYICESVSSARYKTDVRDMPRDVIDKVMAFRPVTFRSKCHIDDPDQIHFGLIAEEVEAIEPRLVMYGHASEDYVNEPGKEGEPIKHYLREGAKKQVRGLDYNAIIALLLSKVQDQDRRIAQLEAKLNQ